MYENEYETCNPQVKSIVSCGMLSLVRKFVVNEL